MAPQTSFVFVPKPDQNLVSGALFVVGAARVRRKHSACSHLVHMVEHLSKKCSQIGALVWTRLYTTQFAMMLRYNVTLYVYTQLKPVQFVYFFILIGTVGRYLHNFSHAHVDTLSDTQFLFVVGYYLRGR